MKGGSHSSLSMARSMAATDQPPVMHGYLHLNERILSDMPCETASTSILPGGAGGWCWWRAVVLTPEWASE